MMNDGKGRMFDTSPSSSSDSLRQFRIMARCAASMSPGNRRVFPFFRSCSSKHVMDDDHKPESHQRWTLGDVLDVQVEGSSEFVLVLIQFIFCAVVEQEMPRVETSNLRRQKVKNIIFGHFASIAQAISAPCGWFRTTA